MGFAEIGGESRIPPSPLLSLIHLSPEPSPLPASSSCPIIVHTLGASPLP